MQILFPDRPRPRRARPAGRLRPALLPAALGLLAAPLMGGEGIEWRADVGFTTAYAPAFSGHHAVDSQGNVLATSNAWSYATSKLSPTGELLWIRSVTGGSGTQSLHLAIDSQDNCIVAGYQEGLGGGFLTTKYDPAGNQLWKVITLHGSKDEGFRVDVDAADNVYVTGRSLLPSFGYVFQTIKYDPNGNELWFRRFDTQVGQPRAIDVAPDGRVVVTGSFGSNFGTVCYDADGDLLWWDSFPGIAGAEHVVLSDAGDAYVCGTGIVGDLIGAVVHYDPAGDVQWVGTYNTPGGGWDRFRRVALHADGSVVATGQGGPGYESISTVKFDATGALAWARLVPDTNSNDGWGTDVALDEQGTAYVTGFKSYQTWSSGVHTVAIRYDAAGNEQWLVELPCTGASGSIALAGAGAVLVSSANHVIRVGPEPVPFSIAVEGSPVPPGGQVDLTFRAFEYPGATLIAAASLGTTPGIATPYGTVPLNPDGLFKLSLASISGAFTGFYHLLPCDGLADGAIQIPDTPAVSGFVLYVACVAVPNVFDPPPWGISAAVPIQIQ